ncbi:MAG: response regulator transcription factor [Chloroflexi bacterium]|nr:response regulator transcription factor [Chloroflexota bacterium]
MAPINLMVVDDQTLFREALVRLLSSQQDFRVVVQASDGQEAIEKAGHYKPDVILLDLRMPKVDGLEATRKLRQTAPDAKIVILTVSDDESDVFEALKNGAVGYLVKSMRAETLFQKVRDIAGGEVALSPLLASKVIREFARLKGREERTAGGLSDRELEVLRLVAEGRRNKEIADALYITEATVKRHLHNILQKLHARNRAEAAAYSLRLGLTREQPKEI